MSNPSSRLAKKKCPAEPFGENGTSRDIATAVTIQCSVRIPDTFLQSIAMATMTAISSTNPTGSIALLPAALAGAVADDEDEVEEVDLEVVFEP